MIFGSRFYSIIKEGERDKFIKDKTDYTNEQLEKNMEKMNYSDLDKMLEEFKYFISNGNDKYAKIMKQMQVMMKSN